MFNVNSPLQQGFEKVPLIIAVVVKSSNVFLSGVIENGKKKKF